MKHKIRVFLFLCFLGFLVYLCFSYYWPNAEVVVVLAVLAAYIFKDPD